MGTERDSEAEREGGPLMDAETRAALERSIDALDRSGWAEPNDIARLQALLDEKGGVAVRPETPGSTPMATSSPGALPDSPAKSIAEDIESAARGLEHIAARVEALGLEPSEQVRVDAEATLRTMILDGIACTSLSPPERKVEAILGNLKLPQIAWALRAIAALTPIAERKL